MSFFFKSKKSANPSALPSASRDIRSSEGPTSSLPQPSGGASTPNKAVSPPPSHGASANNSLNSIAGSNNENVRAQPSGAARPLQDEKEAYTREPTGRGSGAPSPERKPSRERSREPPRQRLTMQPRPPADSPYPWSSRPLTFTLSHTNPFPRYGAAVNAISSKDGSIYLMGGLINGSTVKGDLWMVDAGPGAMTCYPVATTSEGPGPRVGHASLLVGNAFIVFGGDTKMDEGDLLDDTLYLLNTSTKQWSRALPAGPRPPGRYGHTLNILGSKIYIFGGQVEGYFFNDLVAFDLNALQQATNRWEILIQNTIDGGPPHGQIPPARTNHTTITWGDKLYLFGGTDGVQWFNDVWCYSPQTNSWTQLECIGYIPSPREGHAAALVGDVMYIFGGRTEEGNDLGDLAAFRITSKRWYTFQNMGPSPSPRSGHSMTTVGKQIAVLAGEPSSAPRDPVELSHAYFLDTGKIRYPPDSASQSNDRVQGQRRPSTEKSGLPIGVTRSQQSPSPHAIERERVGSGDSRIRSESATGSRLPQASASRTQQQLPAPSGPPPQAPPQQPRSNGVPTSRQPSGSERAFSPTGGEMERKMSTDQRSAMTSPQPIARGTPTQQHDGVQPYSPITATADRGLMDANASDQTPAYKPETYQPSQDQPPESMSRNSSRRLKSRQEMERLEEAPRESEEVAEQTSKVKELKEEAPKDSGLGSSPAMNRQSDEISRELDQIKQRNAWYASELALARKSGYQARATDSPVLDERAPDVFGDDDKPLIEALLKMRAELSRVQDTIDQQSKQAAEKVAEMEKQRDNAINEAVHAKTKLAGQSGSDFDGDGKRTPDPDRNNDMSRRLASSLTAQRELSRRVDGLIQEIEGEKRARQLAEETADAAQKRVTELDGTRQQHSSEVESLRIELYEAQREAREASASHAEIRSQHDTLTLDRNELDGRLQGALAETQNHTSILTALREAVTSSHGKADMLERKAEEERGFRDEVERKLRELKAEHEERTSELDGTKRRLQEAEEMADRHAEEARTHKSAVMAGLGTVTERSVDSSQAVEERVVVLQQQVESANSMVRKNQEAADAASEKLRRAEERIAGLEAFQEQASREGLSIRKQLQSAMRENQALSTQKSDLEQKVQSQMLESNALAVQHASLRDVLGDRGISASEARKSRAMDSPNSRFSTPDLHRVKELEQHLEASLKSHDEMKTQFEEVSERDEKMKREYEDKLTALDNDYQAAVKYLRGTEKMLSKMKQELQRVKGENGDLRKKMESGSNRATPDVTPPDWEAEREKLKKDVADSQSQLQTSIADMEGRLSTLQTQLSTTEQDLATTRHAHTSSQSDLAALHATHEQSRTDLDALRAQNASLEARAHDAENKVHLLLDQVESSVDNYRRQSRMAGDGSVPLMNGTLHARHLSGASVSDAPSSAATETPGHGHSGTGNSGAHGHARSFSAGGDSIASTQDSLAGSASGGHAADRSSLALDSLASELDALRSHWETTNKNYRLSDKFDFEQRSGPAMGPGGPGAAAQQGGGSGGGETGAMASWRAGLGVGDDADTEDESEDEDARGKGRSKLPLDDGEATPRGEQFPAAPTGMGARPGV